MPRRDGEPGWRLNRAEEHSQLGTNRHSLQWTGDSSSMEQTLVHLPRKCIVPTVQLYSQASLPFFLAAGSLAGGHVLEIRTAKGQSFKLNGISREGTVWLSGFPLRAGRNLIEPATFPCRYLNMIDQI